MRESSRSDRSSPLRAAAATALLHGALLAAAVLTTLREPPRVPADLELSLHAGPPPPASTGGSAMPSARDALRRETARRETPLRQRPRGSQPPLRAAEGGTEVVALPAPGAEAAPPQRTDPAAQERPAPGGAVSGRPAYERGDAAAAIAELTALLDRHPEFRRRILREIMAGDGLLPDTLRNVDLRIAEILAFKPWKSSWEYEMMKRGVGGNYTGEYDPVFGYGRTQTLGLQVNPFALLKFLKRLLGE